MESPVARLERMNRAMDALSARVETMDQLIDPSDPSTFKTALAQLQEIITELESLRKIESTSLATNSGNSKIVHIVKEITEMLTFTQNLKEQLEGAVEEHESRNKRESATGRAPPSSSPSSSSSAPPPSSSSSSSSTSSSSTSSPSSSSNANQVSHQPLTRQEIAKLLLLVSKAYQMNILTSKQRSNLKNQIIMRAAYLRLIVQSSDIKVIMGALAAISNEAA